ncbi:MAG: alkyl sulfatase dimerization domain-containing protein [Chloroflexota bacterium]|nr:alkyl sulfatase dimerization domain-containing protein [Chloroflexota bacterium]
MVAEVRLPRHLEESPYLRQLYSRVEFAVMTIHRRYAGWFDWDPADLFPTPRGEVARNVRGLIGDDGRIIARAAELRAEGKTQEAIEVLQILLRAEPEHVEGRRLRLAIMEELAASDRCLMSRSVWLHYAELDRAFLGDGSTGSL